MTNADNHMASARVADGTIEPPKRESVGHTRYGSSSSHRSRSSFDGFQFPPQPREHNLRLASGLQTTYGNFPSAAADDVVEYDPSSPTESIMDDPLPGRPRPLAHSGLPATVSSTPYGGGGGGATHPDLDTRRNSISTFSPSTGYRPNATEKKDRRQPQQQQHSKPPSRSKPHRHPSNSSRFKAKAPQQIGLGHPGGTPAQPQPQPQPHRRPNWQEHGKRVSGKGGSLNHGAVAFIPSGSVHSSVPGPVYSSPPFEPHASPVQNPAMSMNGLGNVMIYNHPPQSTYLQPAYAHSPVNVNGMVFYPLGAGQGYQQQSQYPHYPTASNVYGSSPSFNASPMPISRAFPVSPQVAGGVGSGTNTNYGHGGPIQANDLANGVDLPYSTDTSTRFRGGIAHPYQGKMKYAAAPVSGAVANHGSGSSSRASASYGSSYPLSVSESSSASSSSSSRSPIHDVNHPYYDLANPEPSSPSELNHAFPPVLSTPFKHENNPLALARADIQAGQLYLKTQLEQLVDSIPQLNAHVRHCVTRTNSARLKIAELRKELKRLYIQQRSDIPATAHHHHHHLPLGAFGALSQMNDAAYLREVADYERKTQQVFDSVARGQATYHPKALAALGMSLTIVKQGLQSARLRQQQQEQQQLERQKFNFRKAKRQAKQSLEKWLGILEEAESREEEAKMALDQVRRRVRELEEGCSSTGDGSYSPGAEVRALADSMLTTL